MLTRNLQDVVANTEFHTAWIKVCEFVLHTKPNSKAALFVQRMLPTEQAIVARLARTLRIHDYPANRVQARQDIITQARKRSTPEAILRFIHQGAKQSLQWYKERCDDPKHHFHDLWVELSEHQGAILADLEEILNIK